MVLDTAFLADSGLWYDPATGVVSKRPWLSNELHAKQTRLIKVVSEDQEV